MQELKSLVDLCALVDDVTTSVLLVSARLGVRHIRLNLARCHSLIGLNKQSYSGWVASIVDVCLWHGFFGGVGDRNDSVNR